MANPIKYSTGSETKSLKKGNFYIGTGDVGKGPSDVTGYYNGVNPSEGGYVIYMNREGAPGDLSYHNAPTDSELISFTNNLAGQSFTTANECLSYYAGQSDKVVFNREYEPIVTDGLVMNLDAGFTPSYPKNGTTWYDVSTNTNNGTLINGPTFNSGNGGSISVDGTNDIITVNDNSSIDLTELTFSLWFNRGDILPLATGDQQNFFVKGNTNAPGGDQMCPAFKLRGPTGGGQYIWAAGALGGGGGSILPPSQIFFANQWYNMTITHISTQTPIPYLNGVKQTDWVATNPTNPLVPNNFPMSFAGDVNRDVSERYANFNGKFAIFQMYNRALTEQEVLQNWNAQKDRFGL
jgi:hypothetical protein